MTVTINNYNVTVTKSVSGVTLSITAIANSFRVITATGVNNNATV